MATSKNDRVKCPLATETDESDINCESKRQFAGIVAKFHRVNNSGQLPSQRGDKSRASFGQISGVESGAPSSMYVQGGKKNLSMDKISRFIFYSSRR